MNTAPNPKDVQEFQFKQSSTSQILDAFTSIPIACSLIAVDKKRGLLYVAQDTKICVLKPGEDSDPEWRIKLDLSVVVSKLMLSSDCSYLAVVPHGPSVLVYNAQALATGNLQLLHEIRSSSSYAQVFVNDLRWNPGVPGMVCTVASDYTVGSFEIKQGKTIELKALKKLEGLDMMCAAWSPKGKQIVIGCKNGNIVQLKPDLKVARAIPGPTPYIGEVVSILWISNYQFCAAYLGGEQKINVLIVDAPKGEANAIFTCYEDITYGMSDGQAEGLVPRYYFDYVPEWGLIIAASSNSSEIAVLGTTDGGASWSQWQLVDSGRAELPLIRTTESYPVGIAIDKSPSRKLAWGADAMLPHPVPILHILATSGQLCSFHMVNLTPNCPPINSPPTEIIAIPPQAQTIVGPDTSMTMNGLITSTPRPKPLESISDRSKSPLTRNIFAKPNEGGDFFMQSTLTEEPKQQVQKPGNVIMEMKVEPPKEHVQETAKSSVKLTAIEQTTIPQEPVEQKTTVEDEGRDIRAYIEEHNLFEKELRNRLEPQNWECGTEKERTKLVETTHSVDQFLKELRETTNSLSSDIAYLKALLLQSFAWVEETKSKNAANNDITTRCFGDSNKISDLQKLYYYTQTQLTQASKILDLEWSNRKSQEMSRMKIPSIEFVYQNLILHYKIIQEEKSKLEKLKKKWKVITRNNNTPELSRPMYNLSISSSKSSDSLPRNAGIIEVRCKAIASKAMSFTPSKQTKLRKHLSESTPRIIKPVNPSPIQHRLEATLASLAALNTSETAVATKTKVEEPVVLKQTPVAKVSTEKAEQQSPLASLNSIVARIGTSEATSVSSQKKNYQPATSLVFPAVATSEAQTQKSPITPTTVTTSTQTTEPKQDTVTFSQVNTPAYALPNLMESFPKVDSISFGTPSQKLEETQKLVPKDTFAGTVKEAATNDSFKVTTNLFGGRTLKDALSSETSGQVQRVISSAPKFGAATASPIAIEPEPQTPFSFAIMNTTPATVESPIQNTIAAPQTTAAQTFSFASKPSSNTPSFGLTATPTTAVAQTQESLNLTGLFTGLQASNQTPSISNSGLNINYEPTVRTPSFQMTWGKETPSSTELSITLVSGTALKDKVSITPSVSIEKVTAAETKAPSFATSPVQAPATSATPLFGQTNASNISILGGVSSSIPTTSAFPVTTSVFGIPAAATSSMPIFSFNTAPTMSTTASAVATTSSTVSPFYSSLSEPNFGEALNLSTPGSAAVNSSPPETLTFGAVTTTATGSVFGEPASALTMNIQFPSAPAPSSAANAFDKPIISSASMSFGNTPNTSIFGGASTTTTASIFSGSNTGSIFGANTQASSNRSIFGGNTSSMNAFGTPQKSIFNSNAPKTGSIFGGTAFGQAASFDAKPVFGAQPTFDSKPIFGGGFNASTPPAFGSPPIMGGSPAPMENMTSVFGTGAGNSTFEFLGSQPDTGLSFSSLAQKSPEVQKPPEFTSGSTFSSWR